MIDILLTTYNGEKFISEQIESILCQSYTDWKLIVQDDCSTDHTAEILYKYQNRYPDKIKIYINKQNTGYATDNFFKLIKKSTNDYIMFCDQDDVWLSDKIQKTADKMKYLEDKYSNNMPVLVHTDLKVVDENLNIINNSLFEYQQMNYKRDKLNNLLVQNIVTGCTMMVNKTLISMVKDNCNNVIMHDWWLTLIAAIFGKIGFVNESTILYRQHTANQVGAKKTASLKYLFNKFLNNNQVVKLIDDTYTQAEKFLNVYGALLNKKDFEIISQYVDMKNHSKFGQLHITHKYRFYKYGFLKKIGQIIIKILKF